MNTFPPNINPELFSLIGSAVGFILEDDYTATELNSIGNWIILVGQFMLTTAAQQQLINSRHNNIVGSRIRSDRNSHHITNKKKADQDDLDVIKKMLKKLQDEIEELKKNR